jgi:ATP-dependent DNA ligase
MRASIMARCASLTRTGLDWTHKYPAIADAVASLAAKQAYLDGELCGVRPDGTTSFSMIQLASDSDNAASLVFFLFDLLYLDGEDVGARPLIERKARLAALLAPVSSPLQYSDHQTGHGRAFFERACGLSLEGIVSKRADAPYAPGRSRPVAQGQMPAPRGIRGGRLDRSRRKPAPSRRPAARLL